MTRRDRSEDLEIVYRPEYAGTGHRCSFSAFASAFDREWRACARRDELASLCGDENIAKVLWRALNMRATEWILTAAPALGGNVPRKLMTTEAGRQAVRELLVRLDESASNLAELTAEYAKLTINGEAALEALRDLLTTHEAARGPEWSARLADVLTQANFYVPNDPERAGPDNLTYLAVHTGPSGYPGAVRRAQIPDLLQAATERGLGIAVDPALPTQYVLSYGSLWMLRTFGRVAVQGESNPYAETHALPAGAAVRTVPPDGRLLPSFARAVLNELFSKLGHRAPRVYAEINAHRDPPAALVFNLFDSVRRKAERERAAALMSWYMPPGLAFALVETTAANRNLFTDL